MPLRVFDSVLLGDSKSAKVQVSNRFSIRVVCTVNRCVILAYSPSVRVQSVKSNRTWVYLVLVIGGSCGLMRNNTCVLTNPGVIIGSD
jgi:hypothetical protein